MLLLLDFLVSGGFTFSFFTNRLFENMEYFTGDTLYDEEATKGDARDERIRQQKKIRMLERFRSQYESLSRQLHDNMNEEHQLLDKVYMHHDI